MGTSIANVTKDLKAFLNAKDTGVEVMCKALTGKGLHTWIGMIGYVMKVRPLHRDTPHALP